MAMAIKDITGQRFGLWSVIEQAGTNRWNEATWSCRCDCGTVRVVAGKGLRAGTSRSCGCAKPALARATLGKPPKSTPAPSKLKRRELDLIRTGGRGREIRRGRLFGLLAFHQDRAPHGFSVGRDAGPCR